MSQLSLVTKGKQPKPTRLLLYGVEGVGKSSFAANAPNPIFICTESGTEQLDIARFPEPTTLGDVSASLRELAGGEHDYKTLVIDTLDRLEPLIWHEVISTHKDKRGRAYESIADVPYGAGYDAALEHWRVLVSQFEYLRSKRGMGLVLIAHSAIKTFKNPEGEDFDRYGVKVHHKAGGLLREWCDDVLFAAYETYVAEINGRSKGVSTGARVLHSQRSAAWDAKNRHDLPPTLPLDWQSYAAALDAHQVATPQQLRAQIEAACLGAPPELVTRVAGAMVRAENAQQLARILNKLQAEVSILNANNQPQDTTP
jgi:hypothetical protein